MKNIRVFNDDVAKVIFFILFTVFGSALFIESSIKTFSESIKWLVLFFILPLNYIIYRANIRTNLTLTSIFMFLYLAVLTMTTIKSPYFNNEGLNMLLGFWFLFLIGFVVPSSTNYGVLNAYHALGYYSILVISISLIFIFNNNYWGGTRFHGLYANSNGLGSIAVVCFIYSCFEYTKNKNKFLIFISIISMFTIITTQSRGAILGLIAALVMLLIISENRKKLISAIILFLFFVTISYIILNLYLSDMFIQREYTIGLDYARKLMLERYIQIFDQYPLFGVGLSTSPDGKGRFSSELAYADILTYSGLIGFIFFVTSIFCRLCADLYTIINRFDINIGPTTIFLSLLVMSLGDGYISNIGNPLSIFVWVYLGSKLIYSRKEVLS